MHSWDIYFRVVTERRPDEAEPCRGCNAWMKSDVFAFSISPRPSLLGPKGRHEPELEETWVLHGKCYLSNCLTAGDAGREHFPTGQPCFHRRASSLATPIVGSRCPDAEVSVLLTSTYRFARPGQCPPIKLKMVGLRHAFLLKSGRKAIWKGRWEGRTGLQSLTATFSGQIGLRKEHTWNLGTNSLKLSVPRDPLEILHCLGKAYSRQVLFY